MLHLVKIVLLKTVVMLYKGDKMKEEDVNLVERIKLMYNNNEYEIKADNNIFIIKNVEYTINEEFLREVYKWLLVNSAGKTLNGTCAAIVIMI